MPHEMTGTLTYGGSPQLPRIVQQCPCCRTAIEIASGARQDVTCPLCGTTFRTEADDVTANAPMTEDHFFVVPKVVE